MADFTFLRPQTSGRQSFMRKVTEMVFIRDLRTFVDTPLTTPKHPKVLPIEIFRMALDLVVAGQTSNQFVPAPVKPKPATNRPCRNS